MKNELITLGEISATDLSAVRWGRSLWSYLFSLHTVFNISAFWWWHHLYLISSFLSHCCWWLITLRVFRVPGAPHVRCSRRWGDLLCSCLSCLQLSICSSSWSQTLQKVSDNLSMHLCLMLLSLTLHCQGIACRLCADATQRLYNCALLGPNICCSSHVLFLQTISGILLSVLTVQLCTAVIVLTCHLNCSAPQHDHQSWDDAASQQPQLACNESETYLTAACLLAMTWEGRFSVWSICIQQCLAASSVNELSWSLLQQTSITYSILTDCIEWQRCHSASVCVTHHQNCHCSLISLFLLWLHAAEWSVTSHSSVSASQGFSTEDQVVQLDVKREEIVSLHISNCHNDVLSCLQSFTFTKSHLMQSAVFFSLCLFSQQSSWWCVELSAVIHIHKILFSAVLSLPLASLLLSFCSCVQISVFVSSSECILFCSHLHLHLSAVLSFLLILTVVFSCVQSSVSSLILCLQHSSHLILSCLFSSHSSHFILSVCLSLSAVSALSAVLTSCLVLSCLLCSSCQSAHLCLQFLCCLQSSHLVSFCLVCSAHLTLSVLLQSLHLSAVLTSSLISLTHLSLSVLQFSSLSAASVSYLSSCLTQLSLMMCYSLCVCLQSLHLILSHSALLSSAHLVSIVAVSASVCSPCILSHLVLSHSTHLSFSVLQSLHLSAVSVSHFSCLISLSSAHLDVVLSLCLSAVCVSSLVSLSSSCLDDVAVSASVCSSYISSLLSCLAHQLSSSWCCLLFSVCLQSVSYLSSHSAHLILMICSLCVCLQLSHLVSCLLSHSSCQLVCPCLQNSHCLQSLHLLLSCLVSLSSPCQCCSHCVCLQPLRSQLSLLALQLLHLPAVSAFPALVVSIAVFMSVCSSHTVCSLWASSCVVSSHSAHLILSVLLQSLHLSAVSASCLISTCSAQLMLAYWCCSLHICLQFLCYVSHLILLSSAWWCVAVFISACSFCVLSHLILLCSAPLIFSVLLQLSCLSAVSVSWLILSHLTWLSSSFQCYISVSVCSLCISSLLSHLTQLSSSF